MRIAVLADDGAQANLVCQSLAVDGHVCDKFSEGRALMKHLRHQAYRLLVLDWDLDDMSAEEVLHWVHQRFSERIPVLIMADRLRKTDNSSMSTSWADDYVVKPVVANVVLARVRSLLRRAYQFNQAVNNRIAGDFEFELESKRVVVHGTTVTLTQKEFELAWLLLRHLNESLSRTRILEEIWRQDMGMSSRTLDTHVSMLRAKLGLRPENGYRLTSIYGYGYRLQRIKEEGA